MKQLLSSFFLFLSLSSFCQDTSKYVNPFIGTGGHGHTYPGATVPFGMVQLSPDTRIDGSWDGCSGYHFDDKLIYGFSHTHLNGTGCSDYGDIMLMPTMGEPNFNPKEYSSTFSHNNEKASAGFYSVTLDKHNINASLTASTRVGFHQYTFNNAGVANIILDLNHRDKLLYGDVKIINNKTIQILRRSEAWAKDQYVYAQIEFNVPMQINKVEANQEQRSDFYSGTIVKLSFSKQVQKGEQILVKVALSPTSYDGAKLNSSEIKGWDFSKTKKQAEQLWNKELSKIEVTETNKDKLAVFYTALYHTMVQPNIAQDIDGKYRGRDNQIHQAQGFDYYTVFSLWDTFRAAHPLYTLIDKKRTADFINTFIKQYEQAGRLPVWELSSNETDCMIGYHSVSVIADAMAKGIDGFDYEKAFEAAKHSAMLDHLGLDAYKKQGFISMDDEHESVSKTVEYAYDDWCISVMADILEKESDYSYFSERSESWRNLFDKNTGFIRPKKNGGWFAPFDPKEINNNFTEGNSWQYSFFVPQDIFQMIQAYGGNQKFEAKLEEMFNSESKTTGREQADVTGLIGQYAHGNEPSHHMAYLYNYVGKPEKTAEKVHYILDNFYKNAPDGLIGNEDCGQMSAWYVLSSMGIYSVTPGRSRWTTTKPYFDKIKINQEFNISQTITLASTEEELENIGKFSEKAMSKRDNLIVREYIPIITVPLIQAESKSFKDKMKIEIESQDPTLKIMYVVKNDKNNNFNFQSYTEPFEIDDSSTITAYCIKSDYYRESKSNSVSAQFFKKPNYYTIDIKSKYDPQYHAGGPDGLLDGIHGTENWRKGDWQGYQKQDFECVIDRKEVSKITSINANFLQDQRSWILMPTKVEYYVSNDNDNFTLVETIQNTIDPKLDESITKSFETTKPIPDSRYIKVKAYNYGKLPEWHLGFPYDGDAYIFVDEISIDLPVKMIKAGCIDFGPIKELQKMIFEKDQYKIDKPIETILIDVEQLLKENPTMKIDIRSHCDSNEKKKEKLSKKRSQAIFDYLVKNGIDKNRLSVKSFSDSQPLNDCKTKKCTEAQHQQNRRCEFIITSL